MFAEFKSFIGEPTGGDKHPAGIDQDDDRLVAAALLILAAVIDGIISAADLLNVSAHERLALRVRVSNMPRPTAKAGE